MAGDPYVAIVVATLNAAVGLERTLSSIVEQHSPSCEVVVIDGASTDGTIGVLQTFDRHVAHWESQPDHGIFDAWNRALTHVRAQWVLFLGAGDVLKSPQTLSFVRRRLEEAPPNARLCYGRLEIADADGAVYRTLGEPWPLARERLTRGMPLPHPACFHHRAIFDDHGPFDDRFKISGDYDFVLREIAIRPPHYLGDEVLVSMLAGGRSANPAYTATRLREDLAIRRRFGLLHEKPRPVPAALYVRYRLARFRIGTRRAARKGRDGG